MIFGGDWKQLMPVVRFGGDRGAFLASAKTLPYFQRKEVSIHRLTVNQRLLPGQEDYLKRLKCWGAGVGLQDGLYASLDPEMCVATKEQLIEFVFGNALEDPLQNLDRLKGCALLCPLNVECLELNDIIMVKSYKLKLFSKF